MSVTADSRVGIRTASQNPAYHSDTHQIQALATQFPDFSRRVIARIAAMTQLAGPVRPAPPADKPYKVQYQRIAAGTTSLGTIALAILNIIMEGFFMVWLIMPNHWVDYSDAPDYLWWINFAVICSIGIVELYRFVNTVSMSIASVRLRYPIPIEPEPGKRVAFLTSIVPKKEPVEMAKRTLEAATQLEYAGLVDIYILDEGNTIEVMEVCKALRRLDPQRPVYHFSRKGKPHYNREVKKHKHRARTKHGNYNAWLYEVGRRYDYFASVDTDHVPVPSFLQQMMGYFRDPDVAFVTAPQFYGNVDNWVTEAAESQQFPFHSVIQGAGNGFNVSMFVGTNNMVRISALLAIGGLVDSSTEDLATGIKFHSSRNPLTGKRWKSVYTPSLVAIGEGPSTWAEYLQQQDRWAGGTFAILRTPWKLLKLSPARLWHYSLIMSFYPSMAIGWILGATNAWLYALFGAGGIIVPVYLWVALFIDTTATQMYLYNRNRRYNVSPFEPEGTPGFKGMVMSVLAAPVFAVSMLMAMIGKSGTFNVTAKGEGVKRDRLSAYKYHLAWSLVFLGAIGVAIYNGYFVSQALLLPGMSLIICLAPMVHGTLLPILREWRSKPSAANRRAAKTVRNEVSNVSA